MGQRLNVEIVVNERTIANVYMHWSAYTGCSLQVTKSIIKAFEDIKKEDLENLNVIYERIQNALPNASIPLDEKERLEKQGIIGIELVKDVNRNDGLVAFTEKGIEETRDWEEGRTTIDIQNKKVMFDVYWMSDGIEDDEYVENLETISDNPFRNWLSYDDFKQVADEFIEKIQYGTYSLKLPNNDILHFIE